MKSFESKQHPDENLNACDAVKVLLWMLTLAGRHKTFERWVTNLLQCFSADMALKTIL